MVLCGSIFLTHDTSAETMKILLRILPVECSRAVFVLNNASFNEDQFGMAKTIELLKRL